MANAPVNADQWNALSADQQAAITNALQTGFPDATVVPDASVAQVDSTATTPADISGEMAQAQAGAAVLQHAVHLCEGRLQPFIVVVVPDLPPAASPWR